PAPPGRSGGVEPGPAARRPPAHGAVEDDRIRQRSVVHEHRPWTVDVSGRSKPLVPAGGRPVLDDEAVDVSRGVTGEVGPRSGAQLPRPRAIARRDGGAGAGAGALA